MKKYLVYKEQIQGFQDVMETVKVTEKAAAAHVHSLKKSVSVLLDYENALKIQLGRLSEIRQDEDNLLLKKHEIGKRVLLIIGGDKGIVGSLYHDLVNEFLQKRKDYLKVFVLGDKVKEYMTEEGIETEQFDYDSINTLDLEEVKKISLDIL